MDKRQDELVRELEGMSPLEISDQCRDVINHPFTRKIIEWAKTGSEADRYLTQDLGWSNEIGKMARRVIYLREQLLPDAWNAFWKEPKSRKEEDFVEFGYTGPISGIEMQSARKMGKEKFSLPLPLLLLELKDTSSEVSTFAQNCLGNDIEMTNWTDLLYKKGVFNFADQISYEKDSWKLNGSTKNDSEIIDIVSCVFSPDRLPPQFWRLTSIWQTTKNAINHIRAGIRSDTGPRFKGNEGFILFEKKAHLSGEIGKCFFGQIVLRVHYDIRRLDMKDASLGVYLSHDPEKQVNISIIGNGESEPLSLKRVNQKMEIEEAAKLFSTFSIQQSNCLDPNKILGSSLFKGDKLPDLEKLLLSD